MFCRLDELVDFLGWLLFHHAFQAVAQMVLKSFVEAETTVIAHMNSVLSNVSRHFSTVGQNMLESDFSYLLSSEVLRSFFL